MNNKPTTILALVLALCITAAGQGLSVENPSSILVDGEFTANVTASGCNITGIEFTLTFDGSLLAAMNVTQGDFFSGEALAIPYNLSDATGAWKVTLGATLMEGQECGNGTLAQIRFQGIFPGESNLGLTNVTVTDDNLVAFADIVLLDSSVQVDANDIDTTTTIIDIDPTTTTSTLSTTTTLDGGRDTTTTIPTTTTLDDGRGNVTTSTLTTTTIITTTTIFVDDSDPTDVTTTTSIPSATTTLDNGRGSDTTTIPVTTTTLPTTTTLTNDSDPTTTTSIPVTTSTIYD